MPAIIKDKTKYQSASDYRSLIAAGTTSLYYYYGNPVSWATYPGGAYTDANPPAPVDTTYNEKQIWDGIIGLKKVTLADTKLGFRRVNWTSGQFYDMYREDYDGSVLGVSLAGDYLNTKPLSLSRSSNVVLVDVVGDGTTYRVYRCIDNRSATTGYPIASTSKPVHTTSAVQTTADGYKWKYLGQLDTTDINEFLTPTICPVPATLSTASVIGGATAVVMTSRGVSYTGTPTITVKGDGTGLTLGTPVLSGGGIAYIPVTSAGIGYTYAEVTITGTGTSATAKVILAPTGGFASNVERELEPNFLCVRVTNINTDATFTTRGAAATTYGTATAANNNTPQVNGLSYRTVGLIENPYNYGTSIKATSTLLSNFKEFRYNVLSGATPTYGYRYYTAASGPANAVGTVVGVRSDAITFDGSSSGVVNTTANTITLTSHPFVTGDAVTYYSGSGTTIIGSGISNGATLYIIRDSDTQIRLATSLANAQVPTPIDITSVGSGTVHKLVSQSTASNYIAMLQTTEQKVVANPLVVGNQLTSVAGYTASSIFLGPYLTYNAAVLDTSLDVFSIFNHPFNTGDAVVYSNGGGTSPGAFTGGFTSGNTYYVIKYNYSSFRLARTYAEALAGTYINFTTTGSGSNHSLTYSGSDSVLNPTVERYSGNIIFAENRTPATRTTSEKFRFLLEF